MTVLNYCYLKIDIYIFPFLAIFWYISINNQNNSITTPKICIRLFNIKCIILRCELLARIGKTELSIPSAPKVLIQLSGGD